MKVLIESFEDNAHKYLTCERLSAAKNSTMYCNNPVGIRFAGNLVSDLSK